MERLGKYEIVRRLTVGGMAELYLAKQRGPSGFEKTVVVKRLLPSLAGEEQVVKMFVNEARIAARLNHPNIAQIYDLGVQGKDYFLAMEHVAGYNLAEVQGQAHAASQPLGPDLVTYVVSRICRGLQHAHDLKDSEGRHLGIVHRDVSPQNVIVSFAGEVKLVDFGIAKATALAAETQAGLLKGKYAYMSPEQCRNEPVDARSDLFSVGIILYELLCRRRLFRRQSEFATMRAVLEDPIPPPSAVADDVPDALEEVVMRALQRSPADRYPDAQSLEHDLEQAAAENGWKLGSPAAAEYMARLYPLTNQVVVESGAPSVGPDEITQRGANQPQAARSEEATAPGRTTPGRPIREQPTLQEGTEQEVVVTMPTELTAPRTALTGLAPEPGLHELEPEPEDGERTVMTAPSFPVVEDDTRRPAFIDAKTEAAPVREWRPPDAPTPAPPVVMHPQPTGGGLIAPASLGAAIGPPVRLAPAAPPRAAPPPPAPAPIPIPIPAPAVPAVALAPSAAIPPAHGLPGVLGPEDPQARLATTVLPELPYAPRRRVLFVALVAAATATLAVAAILLVLRFRGSPQSYPVALRSTPPGATVYVNGEKRFGVTPLTIHGLAAGRGHELLVVLEGHLPHRGTLTLDGTPGSRALEVKLRPQGGDPSSLLVTVDPSGAEVFLDGEKRGTAPVKLDGVPSGLPHTLVIKKDGFEEQTLQIDGLTKGEQRELKLTLAPRKGLKRGVEKPNAPAPPPIAPPSKGPPPKKAAPVETPRPSPSLSSPREGTIGEHLPKVKP
jgi:serine/threonine-protein kinase